MPERFRLFKNKARGGAFYLQDNVTGQQESLRTKDRDTAQRLLHAKNEAVRLPAVNRQMARAYLSVSEPQMIKRTWQDAMDSIIALKDGETKRRWIVAMKDHAFDSIRKQTLIETSAEALIQVVRRGTVSTNVYARRIHNYAMDMDWLLKSIVPKRQWPKVVHRKRRAITLVERQQIIERELNPERRAFYQLCWHLGG